MNDETRRLLTDLEAATRPDEAPAGAGPQAAALREAWLALGRVLDEAEGRLGEPRWTPPCTPLPRRRRWKTAALVAVAASAAVGAAVALTVWSLGGRDAGGLSGGAVASGERPVAPGTVKPAVNEDLATRPGRQTPQGPALAAGALAWDDPLDEEITAAARSLVAIGGDWPLVSGRIEMVREAVEQVRKDLGDGTL